jgi:predicted MFS family arabinose efflux permease
MAECTPISCSDGAKVHVQTEVTRNSWKIILACFVGAGVSISPAFLIPIGLYMKPMSAELGWTRSQLSLGVSVIALVSVLLTPFAGALIDRIGTRPLAWAGAVGMPIGLFCLSRLSPSYSFFLVLSGFIGIVATAGSPMTYIAVLPQWIQSRLGRAIAFSMVGLGVAQMLNSAATSHFISSVGWRGAWMVSALIVGPIGILNCFFLFKDNPAFLLAKRATQQSPILVGLTFAESIRKPVFWLLGLAAMLVCIVASGVSTHSAAIVTDRGGSTGLATAAVMLLGLGSLSGRLLTGLLLDWIAFGLVGGVAFALQGIGVLLLWNGSSETVVLIAMFVVGLATGAELDIVPFALRNAFGMRSYGKLFGVVFALYQLGPVFGAPLMGASFDRMGSYKPMLAIFSALSFIAAVLTILAGYIRVRRTNPWPHTTVPAP